LIYGRITYAWHKNSYLISRSQSLRLYRRFERLYYKRVYDRKKNPYASCKKKRSVNYEKQRDKSGHRDFGDREREKSKSIVYLLNFGLDFFAYHRSRFRGFWIRFLTLLQSVRTSSKFCSFFSIFANSVISSLFLFVCLIQHTILVLIWMQKFLALNWIWVSFQNQLFLLIRWVF